MNKVDTLVPFEMDWEQLGTMSDEDIDLSDSPEITEEMFAKAKPAAEFFAERGWKYDPDDVWELVEHKEDGTVIIQHVSRNGAIRLDPDIQKYFPDAESVNRALRGLIALIPQPQPEEEAVSAQVEAQSAPVPA